MVTRFITVALLSLEAVVVGCFAAYGTGKLLERYPNLSFFWVIMPSVWVLSGLFVIGAWLQGKVFGLW